MPDPYNLQRFVAAQQDVIEEAYVQLRAGRKTGHWMWFIFPQVQGLGYSVLAREFAIGDREEASAYLEHEVLGPRLKECSRLVNLVDGRSIQEIFGSPDDLKFRSSMTLFSHLTAENNVFLEALKKYFNGESDPATLERLNP